MTKQVPATISGFTPLFDDVVSDVGLSDAAVFGKIWRYCQMKDHVCTASQERMAEELGISRRTIMRSIAKLIEHGYIEDRTPNLIGGTHTLVDTGKASMRITVTGGVTESHRGCDNLAQLPVTKSHSKIVLKKEEETLKPQPPHEQTPPRNIYTLYSDNIGMLTAISSDQLADYADLPYTMLERAFTEAVNNNVRRWSYVRAILDKWKVSGYQERPAKQIDYQPIQELTGMAPEELQGTRWQKKTKKLLENLNS